MNMKLYYYKGTLEDCRQIAEQHSSEEWFVMKPVKCDDEYLIHIIALNEEDSDEAELIRK